MNLKVLGNFMFVDVDTDNPIGRSPYDRELAYMTVWEEHCQQLYGRMQGRLIHLFGGLGYTRGVPFYIVLRQQTYFGYDGYLMVRWYHKHGEYKTAMVAVLTSEGVKELTARGVPCFRKEEKIYL